MEAPDREQIVKELLNAGTAVRVEEVLDDIAIRLERSGLAAPQIQAFWQRLHDDLDPALVPAASNLAFHRLVSYARATIQARARR